MRSASARENGVKQRFPEGESLAATVFVCPETGQMLVINWAKVEQNAAQNRSWKPRKVQENATHGMELAIGPTAYAGADGLPLRRHEAGRDRTQELPCPGPSRSSRLQGRRCSAAWYCLRPFFGLRPPSRRIGPRSLWRSTRAIRHGFSRQRHWF